MQAHFSSVRHLGELGRVAAAAARHADRADGLSSKLIEILRKKRPTPWVERFN
jgi:hypothetical protein